MFQPVRYIEVFGSVDGVAPDALMLFQFVEPAVHELSGVGVVWVEKAREHSRGRASPPLIVDDCPKLDE
jgi:hypothetical protein